MKKRLLGSLLAALFVVGLMAPAALAGVNGVAVFPAGTAQVGERIANCDKSGQANVSGEGLNAVPTGENYGYTLDSGFVLTGTNNEGVVDVYQGNFRVCGYLSTPLNAEEPVPVEPVELGASCASTKGHHGIGRAQGDSTIVPGHRVDLKLYNINWKAAAGGILAITGNYQVYGPGSTKKDKPVGEIVAMVNAAPDANEPTDCLAPPLTPPADGVNGQNRFTVSGSAVLVQGGRELEKGEDIPGPGDKKCAGPTDADIEDCQGGDGK